MRTTIRGQGNLSENYLLPEIIDATHLAKLQQGGINSAIPFVLFHQFDGVTANETLSYNIPRGVKCRIIDYWAINLETPSGSNFVRIDKNDTLDMTDELFLTGTGDTDLVRGPEVDDVGHEVDGSAGDFVKFVNNSGAPLAQTYGLFIRVT